MQTYLECHEGARPSYTYLIGGNIASRKAHFTLWCRHV